MMELQRLQERAAREVADLHFDRLQEVGLDRTLDSFYLIGPYPPLAGMREPSPALVDEALRTLRQPVDLYVHFPFCRVMGTFECSFCHFYKELHDDGLETRYVDACIQELRTYRRRLGAVRVRSIYFGGGTFSLISPGDLKRLLTVIRNELEVERRAEIKFEIHADAAKTPEALEDLLGVLRDSDVTHLVIDIQTLNEESLRLVSWGRVRPDDYFDTLEACRAFGFDKFVTGLILGLPVESFESFLRSVLLVATIPQVVTVNIFPLMFRRGDAAREQLHAVPELFPSVRQRDVMHHGARILLAGLGFGESPIYFMNRGKTVAAQQTSKFEGNSLLGIGASSFGMYDGSAAAQYYNTPKIKTYLDMVSRGDLPLWRIGPLSASGLAARRIILGCLSMNHPLDLAELDAGTRSRVAPLVELCRERGLLRLEGQTLSITRGGLLRAEEMSYFFAEPEVRRALAGSDSDGASSRYNYFITRSPEQELRLGEVLSGRDDGRAQAAE